MNNEEPSQLVVQVKSLKIVQSSFTHISWRFVRVRTNKKGSSLDEWNLMKFSWWWAIWKFLSEGWNWNYFSSICFWENFNDFHARGKWKCIVNIWYWTLSKVDRVHKSIINSSIQFLHISINKINFLALEIVYLFMRNSVRQNVMTRGDEICAQNLKKLFFSSINSLHLLFVCGNSLQIKFFIRWNRKHFESFLKLTCEIVKICLSEISISRAFPPRFLWFYLLQFQSKPLRFVK